jgi:penicillin-binding protein 2
VQPTNARPPVPRESTALRLTFLGALVVSLFVLLVGRLWFLQVMTGERFATRAEDQSVRTIEVPAPRGDIVDRDGVPIVDTRYAQVVSVRPDQMGDEATAARTVAQLSQILNMPVEEIQRRIDDPTAGPFANRPIAIDVPTDVILYIHQHGATRFPGVIAERIPLREYPQGLLAAHVVGYTGQVSAEELEQPEFADYDPGDIIGWAGVERSYEAHLQGTEGERRVRVDSRGEILEDLTDASAPQAIPGATVQLTLDADVQRLTEQALVGGIELARQTDDNETGPGRGGTFRAPAGAALVLDADTGEVIAMASYPTFDPEEFVGGVSETYWRSLQDPENHFPLINRAIGGTYPPGSVYKIVSAAAAMRYGFATPQSALPCPGEYEWGGNTYRNWLPEDQGHLNLAESLMRSCDTVYYYLARQMFSREVGEAGGADYNTRVIEAIEDGGTPEIPFEHLAQMSRDFGLDALTEIDLPGERDGVVPGREWRLGYWRQARAEYCTQAQIAEPGSYGATLFTELCSPQGALWRGGDLVNMSIGQGDLQVSPLQVANTFAAVANRGRVMWPHVVRAVFPSGSDEPSLVNEPRVLRDVPVDEEHLASIEEGLLLVTQSEDGTAYKVFQDLPIPIAGKTGTAENKPRQPFAWFGGYNTAPIDGETYVVVAFVEEGGGGSAIAAPIVEQIFAGLAGQQVELQAGDITD